MTCRPGLWLSSLYCSRECSVGPDRPPPQVESKLFLCLWQLCASPVAPGKQGHVSPAEGGSAVHLPLLLGSLSCNCKSGTPPPIELPPLPPTSTHFPRGKRLLRSQQDSWQAGSSQVSLSTRSWHFGRIGSARWGVLAHPSVQPDLTWAEWMPRSQWGLQEMR